MYACPACGHRGIRLLAKWWSWPACPGRCRVCNAYVTAPDIDYGAHLVTSALLLTAGGFLALSFKSVIPLFTAVLIAVFIVVRRWHTQALGTLTPEQVNASRIAEGGVLAVILATVFS
jgi:hypothetical protein